MNSSNSPMSGFPDWRIDCCNKAAPFRNNLMAIDSDHKTDWIRSVLGKDCEDPPSLSFPLEVDSRRYFTWFVIVRPFSSLSFHFRLNCRHLDTSQRRNVRDHHFSSGWVRFLEFFIVKSSREQWSPIYKNSTFERVRSIWLAFGFNT